LAARPKWLDFFAHEDPSRRVLLAGTYNGHPIPLTAAIATLEVLLRDGGAVYQHVDALGAKIEQGLREILRDAGIESRVARQGSAFVAYFMDHFPRDWHDIAEYHDAELDRRFRRAMIDNGIYFFPLATKQCSISALHSDADIERTLAAARVALRAAVPVSH